MLKKKSMAGGFSLPAKPGTGGGSGGWEVRPGGMLVQKRNSDQNALTILPRIKVRVKYGSSFHEVSISPQASFGELKKTLAGPTGVHPQDQKLMYREKERDSKAFLDAAGVNDGSKMVLLKEFRDVMSSRERRVLVESRKNDQTDKASKSISEIGLEINKLSKQVATLEIEICGGKKVEEKVLLNLIELLMTQLLKLDEIVADGDAKLQRREEVRKVQKYIEILDMLKIKNTCNEIKVQTLQLKQMSSTRKIPKPVQNQQQELRNSTGKTKWENFGSGVARFTSSSKEENFQFPFVKPQA